MTRTKNSSFEHMWATIKGKNNIMDSNEYKCEYAPTCGLLSQCVIVSDNA